LRDAQFSESDRRHHAAGRAQGVLRITQAAGVIVIENDIYGPLCYEGEPIPSIKHLDQTGDTILLRSFSKVAFPGLRVGWVIARRR
jgi:2-aminoadipate transaminase